MIRPALQVVAVLLLSVTLVSSAGAACWLPASVPSGPSSHCHSLPQTLAQIPPQVPAHPQPAHSRCCAGGQASALLIHFFTPRPMLRSSAAAEAKNFSGTSGGKLASVAIAPSYSLPGVFALRI